MKVKFQNLNNNDTKHEIIFLSLTEYASGKEDIRVLFDGLEYKTDVVFDKYGRRSFKHSGRSYDFRIVERNSGSGGGRVAEAIRVEKENRKD